MQLVLSSNLNSCLANVCLLVFTECLRKTFKSNLFISTAFSLVFSAISEKLISREQGLEFFIQYSLNFLMWANFMLVFTISSLWRFKTFNLSHLIYLISEKYSLSIKCPAYEMPFYEMSQHLNPWKVELQTTRMDFRIPTVEL